MKLYKIRDWHKRYENAQSRRCDNLHWVPVPARHDAERYCEMMAREDASEIFSAWIICLQVGARSEPRGSLVRSDGSPHTPESLSIKTRGSQKWFEKALPYLTQIGWLECVTTESQSTRSQLGVSSESGVQEGRKEQKEGTTSPLVKDMVNLWRSEYQKAHGEPYVPQWAADGKAAKALVAAGITKERMVELARNAWQSQKNSKAFWCKQAASLRGFAAKFNEISNEVKILSPVRREKWSPDNDVDPKSIKNENHE